MVAKIKKKKRKISLVKNQAAQGILVGTKQIWNLTTKDYKTTRKDYREQNTYML